MKKWIVPSADKDGELSLMASYERPGDAICEAPDNFTDEMEPFFRLVEGVSPSGHAEFNVTIDPKYFDWLKDRNAELREKSLVDHTALVKSVKRHKHVQFFNKLNPAQRFIYSMLGPKTHDPKSRILKGLVQIIFSKKLDLYSKDF